MCADGSTAAPLVSVPRPMGSAGRAGDIAAAWPSFYLPSPGAPAYYPLPSRERRIPHRLHVGSPCSQDGRGSSSELRTLGAIARSTVSVHSLASSPNRSLQLSFLVRVF